MAVGASKLLMGAHIGLMLLVVIDKALSTEYSDLHS